MLERDISIHYRRASGEERGREEQRKGEDEERRNREREREREREVNSLPFSSF